jgi:hypothetical protein
MYTFHIANGGVTVFDDGIVYACYSSLAEAAANLADEEEALYLRASAQREEMNKTLDAAHAMTMLLGDIYEALPPRPRGD